MVRRKDDRPKAIDLRGGLGGRDSERGAQRAPESSPGRRAMRADVRDASNSDNTNVERHLVARNRSQRLTMGFTGPSVVRLSAAGRYAGRRQVVCRDACRRRVA